MKVIEKDEVTMRSEAPKIEETSAMDAFDPIKTLKGIFNQTKYSTSRKAPMSTNHIINKYK
jgi:hypothetical protein